tara:strand:+ start:4995 stop:5984 length:990 start_codon:yes stop_codon:yes gene_type:complete
MKLFSGTANRRFAEKVAKHLQQPLSNAIVTTFQDGEIRLVIEENVRKEDVFIIQPTGPSVSGSPNDNLMELLIFIDAAKRGSANSVTAVIPYYGYERQDRKDYSRAPISARVVASCLETVGVDRVIVFDLHAGQIQGFFSSRTPLDNLYVESYFIKYIRDNIINTCIPLTDSVSLDNIVIVSPDEGGVKRAVRISNKLKCSAATIYKDRSKPNEINKMMLMGDVTDKIAVIVDDMLDTGGTACKAAEIIKSFGAIDVYILVCHGLLSGPAIERINSSAFKKVVITNTLELSEEKRISCPKLDIIDVSWYCAEAMKRSVVGKSLKELYEM